MNMKKTIVCLLAMAVVVLCQSLTACKDDEPEHVHDWEWVDTAPATATADILETETCKTCGAVSGQTRIKFQKNFSITLLGKTVTVTDARTGTSAQNLEQLGVMQKLRDAVALVNDNSTQLGETRVAFDRVLNKGLVIEFNGTGAVPEFAKTRGDKTILFTIEGVLGSTEAVIMTQINASIAAYLDKGIDKVS